MTDLPTLRLLGLIAELSDRIDGLAGLVSDFNRRLSRLERIADDAATERIDRAIAEPLSRIGVHVSKGRPGKRKDRTGDPNHAAIL